MTGKNQQALTDRQTALQAIDPTKEENWHYHDEYEFWYLTVPENGEVTNGNEYWDTHRNRSFKPWEYYSSLAAPEAVDVEALGAVEILKTYMPIYQRDDNTAVHQAFATIEAALKQPEVEVFGVNCPCGNRITLKTPGDKT